MVTEREYKFAVTPDWEAPPIDGTCAADPPVSVEQTATYYDTPDLRLARAGASLRYRDDDGWTVKLPVDEITEGALVRAEHRLGGTAGTPPAAALELVAARVRTSRLVPVARLHTSRQSRILRATSATGDLSPGQAIGALTDDVCTVLDGAVPGRFREVELEVVPGAPGDALDVLAARLRASGGTDLDPRPKVTRALGPTAQAAPDVVSHPVSSPATVVSVIRHAFSDAVVRLVVSDPPARLGDDIEGVHQARVATRRLRSHLRTFRARLEPEWAASLRTELGWLGGALGAVRDADVLLERIGDRVARLDDPDQGPAAPVLDRITADQAAARVALLEVMRSRRYLELLDRLVEAANQPRLGPPAPGPDDDVLRALVRTPWRALRRAVAALPDPAPDAALHAVRIRAKRARYAAEVLEPAFGRHARDFARSLARVQDVLGEHQDAVVAGLWLRATALTLDDPAAVYAAGELGAAERSAADAARRAWPAAWRAAARQSRRWR
ncbi:MAG: CHAD domain-containing protein [Actinomycetota bacterium]